MKAPRAHRTQLVTQGRGQAGARQVGSGSPPHPRLGPALAGEEAGRDPGPRSRRPPGPPPPRISPQRCGPSRAVEGAGQVQQKVRARCKRALRPSAPERSQEPPALNAARRASARADGRTVNCWPITGQKPAQHRSNAGQSALGERAGRFYGLVKRWSNAGVKTPVKRPRSPRRPRPTARGGLGAPAGGQPPVKD